MRRTKGHEGQCTIELVCGLMVVIPIVVFLVDVVSLGLAVFTNDSLCREVAQVAAFGDPSSAAARADQIVTEANNNANGIIKGYTFVLTPYISAMPDVTQAQFGSVVGSMTANTTVTVSPPGAPTVQFTAQQVFPITYSVPQSQMPN